MKTQEETTLTKLEDFGFIAVTGRDATKFLQGYATCDLDDVTFDASRIGAICNLQGRMVTSFRVARTDDGLLLRMRRELVEKTMEFLHKYIVFSKAEMADVSHTMACYGVVGEIPADHLASFPGDCDSVSRSQDHTIIRVDRTGHRYEIWSEGDVSDLGFPPGDAANWNALEIDDGHVWVAAATSESFIPQMFDYHRIGGVDFDKGCYLGQEIVARMQHRGNLNRKLFHGSGAALSVGDSLFANDKSVGTVVAASGEKLLAVVQAKGDAVPSVEAEDGTAIDLEEIERQGV